MKNILFDFGGIFVDLDMEAFNMGVQTYLGMSFKGLYHRYSEVFDGFEIGALSENEFLDQVEAMGLPRNKIKDIWNEMVLGIPKHRIDFLKSLQGKFNLYLYSNTNRFHEQELDRLLRLNSETSLVEFRKLFLGSWFSHDIGFRKPNNEGFEYIIQKTGINPKETLFIDDSPAYLEGAKAVKMKTILHDADTEIVDMFWQYVDN